MYSYHTLIPALLYRLLELLLLALDEVQALSRLLIVFKLDSVLFGDYRGGEGGGGGDGEGERRGGEREGERREERGREGGKGGRKGTEEREGGEGGREGKKW